MVILETAVIGAAGYGLYRGGDAAVRKGKQTQKELKFEKHRRTQQHELTSKQKERSERLARITESRNGKASATKSWLPSSSSRRATTTTTANTTTTAPAAATTKSSNDVNDRYQSVMKKLDEKPKKGKKSIMGIFGKKK
jgi:hypothetical protein